MKATIKLKDMGHQFLRFKLIAALEEVDNSTIFGVQIQHGLKTNNFDQLFSDLRMQVIDNSELVERIIGARAYSLLNQYHA